MGRMQATNRPASQQGSESWRVGVEGVDCGGLEGWCGARTGGGAGQARASCLAGSVLNNNACMQDERVSHIHNQRQ